MARAAKPSVAHKSSRRRQRPGGRNARSRSRRQVSWAMETAPELGADPISLHVRAGKPFRRADFPGLIFCLSARGFHVNARRVSPSCANNPEEEGARFHRSGARELRSTQPGSRGWSRLLRCASRAASARLASPGSNRSMGGLRRARMASVAILFLGVPSGALPAVSASSSDNPVAGAVRQPLLDLSLVQDPIDQKLLNAAANPYRIVTSCAEISEEVRALNSILGIDVDEDPGSQPGEDLVGQIIGGVFQVPFRGLVRRVTGAHERELERRRAIMSGLARRAFLKGIASQRACVIKQD